MRHTHKLATWVSGLRYEDVPADCIGKAKEQLLSIIGAAMMGVESRAGQGVLQSVCAFDNYPGATIFGTDRQVSPGNAAIMNSFAAQIFEFEDWVDYSHTGASVISTAMAVGETMNVSGKELLTTIIIGNELAGRAGRAIARGAYVGNSLPNHQIDAPFVAGRLFGLDVEQLKSAVGLGAFLAMETCPIGFLTDAKGLINSFPAHMGIMAATMAKNGVVGNKDMIEHPAGYLATVSEFVDLDELIDGLGEDWAMSTLHTKPYPICGYNVAAVEAALDIVRTHGVKADEIEQIVVYAPGVTLYTGKRFHSLEPDVFTQIKEGTATHVPLLFDVPYPVAAAIVDGELTPRQFREDRIHDPVIRQLAKRVDLKLDAELHEAYYRFEYGSRVEITTKDDRRYEATVSRMLGSPGQPFDVTSKFRLGAEPLLGEAGTRTAIDLIADLERIDDVSIFARALRP